MSKKILYIVLISLLVLGVLGATVALLDSSDGGEAYVPAKPGTSVKPVALNRSLSGAWKLVDTPALADVSAKLSFTSSGLSYTGLDASLLQGTVNYTKRSGDVVTYYEKSTWLDSDVRVIIFETEQKVSEEFYNWFLLNAEQVSVVSGLWFIFHDPVSDDVISESVRFTTDFDETVYTKMFIGSSCYYYAVTERTDVYKETYTDNWDWVDVNYRYLDFGASPQVVSDAFYSWLTDVGRQQIMLPTGIYKFVKDPITYASMYVNFTSNGENFISLNLSYDKVINSDYSFTLTYYTEYRTTENEYIKVFDETTGQWSDEAYKTINVTEEARVDLSDYNAFLKVAEKIG